MQGERKSDTLRRLKTAGGHLKAVERMIDEDKYCADILLQLQAVIASLEKASNLILENHLETCIRAAIRRGEEEDVIKEMKTFVKFNRK
ncbi:MAG: metal-sensitive transcriptional regulator [Bacillota bacterium]|nr:metal-sensitive transcriptional regulator [Bacillota bacterium]MDW7684142.1 metal-sensitive transcriptional regulator [Bacillota bacterium]